MLMRTDDGWKVWGSVPAALDNVLRGDRVQFRAKVQRSQDHEKFGFVSRPTQAKFLEPISKSPEEDNQAGELDESEEVLGVILPADEDAALPLDPRKEAFDEPTTHVAA